jgi:hypothetical protein
MEYLDTILNLVFGGVGVGGLITAIYYRKANKRIKEEEANKAAVETKDAETDVQSKRMDVADKYFDGMMKMLEQVKSTTDRGSENQDKILEEIGKLKTQNDKQDSLMTDIVAYLNGDFQNYVSQHHKGEAKRR